MTPLEICILLHYHTSSTDFRDGDFSAPAVRHTIDRFRGDLGLLEPDPDDDGDRSSDDAAYRITERGSVFCEALSKVPLPVQVWTMPAARIP